MDISSLSIKEIKSLLETNGTEELWQAILSAMSARECSRF